MYTLLMCFVVSGSYDIEPTQDWTHFLKIVFGIAGGGFYSYYNLQCIKLYKRKKKFKKCNKFYAYKKYLMFFKNGFNPVLGTIPRLP